MVNQPEELGCLDDAEEKTRAENNGVLEQRRKWMGVIQRYNRFREEDDAWTRKKL